VIRFGYNSEPCCNDFSFEESLMDLKHLRAFVAVAESLSFSRAAQRLHVSQPALSKQIRLLEEDLEAKLFVRDRRSVCLTSVGKEILSDAESLLLSADDLKHRAQAATGGAAGRLRMGFVASATPEIIPQITLALHKAFPNVGLHLRNTPTVQQVDGLHERSMDVGIVRLPLREPGIAVFPLSVEPFAIVLSRQHPLRRNGQITMRDLQEEAFVAYSERLAPEFLQHWTGLCRKAGFTPRITQEVAEMETAVALVSAGLGVAVVPEGVARRHRNTLTVIALRGERIRSEVGVAILKLDPPPLARRLVDIALQAVAGSARRRGV
jgi:LysR family transcriptional regulator, benzoate and cis,cis-muconate-responsive activator of ben and cat genes